ncbi:hypothetical protein LTR47_009967 [Exophiala xenobiotica]|nr:hypothetical protein LTR72_011547 [Exophiala xenobiotica]KAK5224210.1 hypothetical protein LTR47_009967 [Exophiala xenobiotica]KAK5284287.1 hypothetical protein LTR40_000565 [Exophiala xenobiotica]KAK5359222.1 hypothetical protein LTR11_010650 [Exophiala xenobiotica]KAK5361031.1 hypothetical protein LTS03_010467 [Exophiala xenobiotica]
MPISISAVASHSYIFLGATAFVAFAALVAWNIISIRGPPTPKGLRRPPSPPGARFFSGHAHLWSGRVTNNPSQSQLVKWAREYGEIYEFRLGVERWVIVSSPEAVKEIFDKNGALTGSRPAFRVMNILSGGYRMLFMPYGKKWRSLRAIAHRCLSIKSAEAIKPSSSLESHRYLLDILRDPDNFLDHVKRYTSSVIMYSIYGRRVLDLDEAVLKAIYEETSHFSEAMAQVHTVDQYPILERLPKSLQWWRPKWEAYHQKEVELWMGLWNDLKKRLNAGVRTGCFAEKFQEEDYLAMGISETQAAYAAGSMIEAGSDTTQLTMNSMILAMVAFPEVVSKAQKELDAVVGDRMPEFTDMPNLPYIRAMVKEVLRWRSGDVVYKDYFIPAGSSVVINQWAMHFDPDLFPEPERFNPDRYLGTPVNDLTAGECIHTNDVNLRDHWSFGAGRRVCAGYNLAENSLLILTARLLWAFDVRPTIDQQTGQETKYDVWNYYPTRLFGPKPFPVDFRVRSEEKRQAILKAEI